VPEEAEEAVIEAPEEEAVEAAKVKEEGVNIIIKEEDTIAEVEAKTEEEVVTITTVAKAISKTSLKDKCREEATRRITKL